MKWHEVIIDLFFYTDILFNFWTGFDSQSTAVSLDAGFAADAGADPAP